MPLTDYKIKTSKAKDKPYKVLDGEGLYIEIRPNGKKYWRYRFNIKSKEGIYTIGEYPSVSLAEARLKKEWAKKQARSGVSPNMAKKAKALEDDDNIFSVIALSYVSKQKSRWSSEYYDQCIRVLNLNVFPEVGDMPIDQIKPIHCLAIIDTITNRGSPTVAILVRQWMSQVFRFAAARLLVESDPTFALKGAIFKEAVRHNPPLKNADIPVFFSKLKAYGGRRITIIAIRLLAHTFVRTGELRKAAWEEFDLKEQLWVIPAENTKKRRKHLVPLTEVVVDYLQELKQHAGRSALLFPNVRDSSRPMGVSTINRVIERLGYAGQFSGHGFRSTASTYLNEGGWNSDVIERQLAHVEQKAERKAYNHAEYLPERMKMMRAWSEFLLSQESSD